MRHSAPITFSPRLLAIVAAAAVIGLAAPGAANARMARSAAAYDGVWNVVFDTMRGT